MGEERSHSTQPAPNERDFTLAVALLSSAIATVLVTGLLYREARRALRRLGLYRWARRSR